MSDGDGDPRWIRKMQKDTSMVGVWGSTDHFFVSDVAAADSVTNVSFHTEIATVSCFREFSADPCLSETS